MIVSTLMASASCFGFGLLTFGAYRLGITVGKTLACNKFGMDRIEVSQEVSGFGIFHIPMEVKVYAGWTSFRLLSGTFHIDYASDSAVDTTIVMRHQPTEGCPEFYAVEQR